MMKIKYLINFATLLTLVLWSCQKDPEFPDPGFELEDQEVEVRRDTADVYSVQMQMEVPNGVQNIEILNATNYELIETIETYNGKKNFVFNYDIDLTSFETDTVLYYIFKVNDKDNRSTNRGFTLSVKQFSFPEIQLVGGTSLNVVVPIYQLKGLVSTGLNELESVQVLFKGDEVFYYAPDATSAEYEYILSETIGFGTLVADEEYNLDVIIKDRKGQISTTTITVRKSDVLKLPTSINVYDGYRNITNVISLDYDEQNRINHFEYYYAFSGKTADFYFTYNDLGMVDTATYKYRYDSDYYQEYGYKYFNQIFKYKEGITQLDKILRYDYFLSDEGVVEIYTDNEVESQDFQYDEDGVLISYYGKSDTYQVQFADPFGTGEKVFAEYWQYDYFKIPEKNRQHRTAFEPIYMPCYMEGLPPFISLSSLGEILCDLFMTKYVVTDTEASSELYTGNYLEEPTYTYETDADGNVTTITRNFLYNGWSARYFVYTFNY